MKTIPLTNRPDQLVKVDDDDYDFLMRFKWFAKQSRWGFYACTNVRVKNRVLTFRMHRLIMRCFDDNTIDHINQKHYDNQKENLEIVTNNENVKRYIDKVPF